MQINCSNWSRLNLLDLVEKDEFSFYRENTCIFFVMKSQYLSISHDVRLTNTDLRKRERRHASSRACRR